MVRCLIGCGMDCLGCRFLWLGLSWFSITRIIWWLFFFVVSGIEALSRYNDQYCITQECGLFFFFFFFSRQTPHCLPQPIKCPTNGVPTETKISTSNKVSKSNARAILNPSLALLSIHPHRPHLHSQHLISNNKTQNNRMKPSLNRSSSPSHNQNLSCNHNHNHKLRYTNYTTTLIKSWNVVFGIWWGLCWHLFCW